MATKEYLDEERKKLWSEVRSLQVELKSLREDIAKRTPEYESEAKQASKKASEYRNRILDSKDVVDSLVPDIQTKLVELNSLTKKVESLEVDTEAVLHELGVARSQVNETLARSQDLDVILDNYDHYASLVEGLNNFHEASEEIFSKISLLLTSASKKKKEVDELHLKIFGFEEEDDETGEVRSVTGLKDELSQTYTKLSSDIENAEDKLTSLIETSKEVLNKKIDEWEAENNTLSQKIKDLLPEALTAGLSHAFSVKKRDEIAAGEKLNRVFSYSILGLILVSLIPFGVDVYQLNEGKKLEDLIQDLPSLMTAIIPLYIPLIWLAYSSNKKANLSKRLVEEYTHKEVLSKTFEGLSSQVESIQQEGISNELRVKLLYNLLEVSAENPGKLISNYKTSDHPLIDTLEKSLKLGESIKKLEKIPGMSKISEMLNKRVEVDLHKQADNISKGLEQVEERK